MESAALCLVALITASLSARNCHDQGSIPNSHFIFVHGVMGTADATWTNRTTKASFPKMVADDPLLGVRQRV
jgi:hypothetical protein